jgi:hypothetical protein
MDGIAQTATHRKIELSVCRSPQRRFGGNSKFLTLDNFNRKEVRNVKEYEVRVYIPIVYAITAENKEQAEQIAREFYRKENKKEMIMFFSACYKHPVVEVYEIAI